MNRKDLSKFLFEKISMVEPYPANVEKIEEIMEITAFFPGGLGLWNDANYEKEPEIMVLGHDFSTVSTYEKMKYENKSELNDPTWRNLRKLFEQVNINLNTCFFTNVFMGLRNTKSMTGTFPGYKDKAFVKRNLAFLEKQIEIVKPKAIITLGKFSAELLGYLSSDLTRWKNGEALTGGDCGALKHVQFKDHSCTCISLLHPSMRNSNLKMRKYKSYTGHDAEVAMLNELIDTI